MNKFLNFNFDNIYLYGELDFNKNDVSMFRICLKIIELKLPYTKNNFNMKSQLL